MVDFLILASAFIGVTKYLADNLNRLMSKKDTSKSFHKDTSNQYNGDSNNSFDILKNYEFLNKPKSPEFQFPKLYKFTEEEPEHNSFTGSINPLHTNTENFAIDFWKKESERTKYSSYDWLIEDAENFLDKRRREREERRRRIYNPYIFFQSEETEIKPKPIKKKSINPDYPICPE